MAKDLPVKYGDRIEYDKVAHRYTIHRPATSQRIEVNYTINEMDVMKAIGGHDGTRRRWSDEDIVEKLFDERIDEKLRPTRRRDAIEHTRRLNGS